jgi:hypothetical protein
MTTLPTTHRAARRALLAPALLLTTTLASSLLVACGARQHIPLDAPRYEDPVGPVDAGAGGVVDASAVPRS